MNGVIDSDRPAGVHIPLRCKVCDKRFHTKNIDFIGARSIFFNTEDCEHPISDLEVVKE